MICTPLEYMVNYPFVFFDQMNNNFKKQEAIIKENTNLKAELLILQAQLQKFEALETENKKLRALLETMPASATHVTVAELMAVALDPNRQQILINQGSKKHVYVGQPVLDARGVFGQVIETTADMSRVLLITDRNSAIPVQDNRNGLRAIAVGNGKGGLNLMNMPVTADVKPGDIFVTSGIAAHFPPGYPLAKVRAITNVAGQGFAKITLLPIGHIYSSRLVLLVWPAGYKSIIEQDLTLSRMEQPKNARQKTLQADSRH